MYQWCKPTGGLMFGGNAGLCSDAQACLEFGTWDYIGCEKDPFIWTQGAEVIEQHMAILDRKEKEIRNRIKATTTLLPIIKKFKEGGLDALTEQEVRVYKNE